MLRFRPQGVTLPLVSFGPIPQLQVGTEARFPGNELGIVTAVGSKTTVQYLGAPIGIGRHTPVAFTNTPLTFPFSPTGIVGRTLNSSLSNQNARRETKRPPCRVRPTR